MKLLSAIFALLAFIIGFSGCIKEKLSGPGTFSPGNTQNFCGINKIFYEDSSHYDQYIFNNQYRIDSIKTYTGNVLAGYTKYHYNNDRNVSLVEKYVNGTLESYTRVRYRISNKALYYYHFYEKINDSLQEIRRVKFDYDDNGRLEKNIYFELGANGLVEEKHEMRYSYDPWQRVIRADEYTKNDSLYTFTAVIIYEHIHEGNILVNYNLITDGQKHGLVVKETKIDSDEKLIYSKTNDYKIDIDVSTAQKRVLGKTSAYSSDSGSSVTKEFYSYFCRPM